MKRFQIKYRDADPGCPVFSTTVKAYDRNHAEEKFLYGDEDSDGWVIVSITEVK